MKKNISLVIFSAIYIVSLALGFGFAGFRRAEITSPTPTGSQQSNWIVVRVDDMSLERPQLVSVWGMFLSFTSGPQIFFKPIYMPETATASQSKLASLFAVNADRTISDGFIQELDHLNIQRSGLVIMDDTGFQSFTAWFNSTKAAAQPNPIVPTTGHLPTLKDSPEVQAYQAICTSLQQPNSPRSQALAWHDLVPNHILPHPNLQSLAGLWDKILSSNIPSHCEVIAY